MLRFILLLVLSFTFGGCSLVYRVVLGVDSTPNWLLDSDLVNRFDRYDIPKTYRLIQDTSSAYRNELIDIYQKQVDLLKAEKADSSEIKLYQKALNDDLQPTQFRLFNTQGTEIFKLVNCYVDPPIPFDWNVEGCFDSFPPTTSIPSSKKHLVGLDFFLSHARDFNGQRLSLSELPTHDYYAVVVWNDYYKRPSKRLIKETQDFVKKTNESILVIYINNHNYYLWSIIDAAGKRKVSQALAKDA